VGARPLVTVFLHLVAGGRITTAHRGARSWGRLLPMQGSVLGAAHFTPAAVTLLVVGAALGLVFAVYFVIR